MKDVPFIEEPTLEEILDTVNALPERSAGDSSVDLIITANAYPYNKLTVNNCSVTKGTIPSAVEKWKNGDVINAEIHFYYNSNNWSGEASIIPARVYIYGEYLYLYYVIPNNIQIISGCVDFKTDGTFYSSNVKFQDLPKLTLFAQCDINEKITSSNNINIEQGDIISFATYVRGFNSNNKVEIRFYKNTSSGNFYLYEGRSIYGSASLYGDYLYISYIADARYANEKLYKGVFVFNHTNGSFVEHKVYEYASEGTWL